MSVTACRTGASLVAAYLIAATLSGAVAVASTTVGSGGRESEPAAASACSAKRS